MRTQAADIKIWTRWRKRMWAWLRRNCGARCGYVRTDPAGDENPELWHPHLNFLWVQRDGFRPFIDVDTIRAAWAKILGVERVDVWTQYAPETQMDRRRHWYSYMGRTWADWQKAVPHGRRVIQLGKLPKVKTDCKCRCPKCGEVYKSLRVGSEKQVDRLVKLGPQWLDQEYELMMQARAESRRRRIPKTK